MSSAFQTDSGTVWAQDGMAEVGREKPDIAALMAASSSVQFERETGREREDGKRVGG